MTLGVRKILVLCLIGALVMMANFVIVGAWLSDRGVIDFAARIACRSRL